nr:MAG: hypothetical protein TU35_04930 [Thermoproteus sp. AZ2]
MATEQSPTQNPQEKMVIYEYTHWHSTAAYAKKHLEVYAILKHGPVPLGPALEGVPILEQREDNNFGHTERQLVDIEALRKFKGPLIEVVTGTDCKERCASLDEVKMIKISDKGPVAIPCEGPYKVRLGPSRQPDPLNPNNETLRFFACRDGTNVYKITVSHPPELLPF